MTSSPYRWTCLALVALAVGEGISIGAPAAGVPAVLITVGCVGLVVGTNGTTLLAATMVAASLLAGQSLGAFLLSSVLALIVVGGALGWQRRTGPTVMGVGVMAVAALLAGAADPAVGYAAAVQPVVVTVAVAAGGWWARTAVDRRVTLEAVRHDLARSEERERLSRDIHDVTAHGLMGVLTQVRVARAHLRGQRHDAVEATLAEVEAAAKAAVAELRGVPSASTTTIRTAVDLEQALRRVVRSFPQVALDWDVSASQIDPVIARVVIAVVGQAVANAAAHAPGADVHLVCADDDATVHLVARNALPSDSASAEQDLVRAGGRHNGNGLDFMRRRVSAVGGVLHASAADGHWTVHARIPKLAP